MLADVRRDRYVPGVPVMQQDSYHMGTIIGKDLIILHKRFTNEEQPYLIIVNERTGESVHILTTDGDSSTKTEYEPCNSCGCTCSHV